MDNRAAEFIIKFKSRDPECLNGYIEHIQTGQNQDFDTILELFSLIEGKLNEQGYPQSTTQIRSWNKEKESK